MDRNPEIAQYIREGHMHHRLCRDLDDSAVAAAERQFISANTESCLLAHQAHSLMQNTAHTAVKDLLRESVARSSYLSILLQEYVEEPENWYNDAARCPVQLAMIRLRRLFVRTYGFPVITPEAVQAIKSHLQGQPLLEVGAGNGYLAHRLQQAGVDVLPTDALTLSENPYDLGQYEHTTVLQADAASAIGEFPEMNLLWSWPVPTRESGEVLQRFTGTTFIYVGEQKGGCTGGDFFHRILDKHFELITSVELPNFPQYHDEVGIYLRRDKM